MNRKFFWSEVLVILLISGQAALYVFMWVRLLSDESLKGMDFISFYTAGRLARAGQYTQLYDLNAQKTIQNPIVGAEAFQGGVNLSQHPPYLAPLLSILTTKDFIQSYIRWSIVRLLVMILCGELIRRFLIRFGWEARPALFGALGCLCFFPFFLGLLGGQDTAFILFGLLLWMFGLTNFQDVRAGFGLAFASLSPTIAGALALPLLASRRRAGHWFIVGMILLGGYSLLLIGAQGAKDFLGLLGLSSQGQGYGLNQTYMYNLLGLLLRSFPGLDLPTAHPIAWGAVFFSMFFMVGFWWNKRQGLRMEHTGIAVVLSVFTSPHLHVHGLSYLLLPLLGLMIILWERKQKVMAILLVPALSTLMLLAAFLRPSWNYPIAYLLMLTLVVSLFLNLKPGVHTGYIH